MLFLQDGGEERPGSALPEREQSGSQGHCCVQCLNASDTGEWSLMRAISASFALIGRYRHQGAGGETSQRKAVTSVLEDDWDPLSRMLNPVSWEGVIGVSGSEFEMRCARLFDVAPGLYHLHGRTAQQILTILQQPSGLGPPISSPWSAPE